PCVHGSVTAGVPPSTASRSFVATIGLYSLGPRGHAPRHALAGIDLVDLLGSLAEGIGHRRLVLGERGRHRLRPDLLRLGVLEVELLRTGIVPLGRRSERLQVLVRQLWIGLLGQLDEPLLPALARRLLAHNASGNLDPGVAL